MKQGWRLMLVLAALLPALAFAHPANVPSALVKVGNDGSVRIRVHCDLLAYVLDSTPADISDGPMNALLDGSALEFQSRLNDAATRFASQLIIHAGGRRLRVVHVVLPTASEVTAFVEAGPKNRLPVMMTITAEARLPKGATTLSVIFPEVLTTVILTTEVAYREPFSEPVEPGNASTLIPLPTHAPLTTGALFTPLPNSSSGEAGGGGASPRATEGAKSFISRPHSATTDGSPSTPLPQNGVVSGGSFFAPPSQHGAGEVPSPRGRGGIDPGQILGKSLKIVQAPIAAALPNSSSGSPERGEVADSRRTEGANITQTARIHSGTPSLTAKREGEVAHSGETVEVPPAQKAPWYRFFPTYVKMGFRHIMPEGIDHILFVLGLFLLSTRAKDLLKQITAFTVAHSITLALSLYGVVRLPTTIVEPIIAASIVFVAVENLFTTEMKSWRLYVVFLFGLVHGLGFATALQDAGLQKSNFLTALVGFNLGVELGQLSVVALAFAAVGWFRSNDKYRKAIVMPASLGIACIALFWTVQRVF